MKTVALHYPQPARRFWQFLPFASPDEILDFGLAETELKNATRLAQWLGVKNCLLKLETTNPTGTVKDRITELTYSWFAKNNITEYHHASTGNTGTSMAWGATEYPLLFSLNLYIAEAQFLHHNFLSHPKISVTLLEGASYDEAKEYAETEAGKNLMENKILSIESKFRKEANKLPFLEAFWQCQQMNISPDIVCQAISSGTGLLGARLAATDAMEQKWITKIPTFAIIQPEATNPIVRCFNDGHKKYQADYIIVNPKPSQAWAIRRGDASGCYQNMRELINENNGFAEDASEQEIIAAKKILWTLENIEAGYTACTALAGIKKYALHHDLSDKTILVMITGRDRDTTTTPSDYTILRQNEWQQN